MLQSRIVQPPRAPVKAPISAHPAFPPIVGLWFGALFGLGCMVMPAVVLESLALGLAEPPLTAGARAVISLLATVLGLGAGLVLARRVVSLHQGQSAVSRSIAAPGPGSPRRPISAHEELGVGPIAAAGETHRPPIAGRRRSLTVTDEAQPSEYLQRAPLPGGDFSWPHLLPAHEDAMTDRPTDPQPASPPAAEELDLAGFAPPTLAPERLEAPTGAQVFAASEPAAPTAPAELPEPGTYVPPLDTRKPREFNVPPAPPAAPAEAAVPVADGALDSLGMVQLIERLARSLQARLAAASEPAAEPLPFVAPSLEQRQQEAAPSVPPPVVPEGLQAYMTEPAEPVPPAPAGDSAAPAVPPAFQPFAFEAEDDDETPDPGPFTLPLGSMSPRPFDAPATPETEEDEADALPEAEDEYTSLLAMKNPFRAREEFVRIDVPEPEGEEIEPAVVFPGQEPCAAAGTPVPVDAPVACARPFDAPHQPAPSTAPVHVAPSADPAETDRALRSALANLQRMSGTA